MCDQHLLLTNHYTIATLAWWWWWSSNYKAISQINWNFAPATLTIAFDTHRAQPQTSTPRISNSNNFSLKCVALVARPQTPNLLPGPDSYFFFVMILLSLSLITELLSHSCLPALSALYLFSAVRGRLLPRLSTHACLRLLRFSFESSLCTRSSLFCWSCISHSSFDDPLDLSSSLIPSSRCVRSCPAPLGFLM